MSTAAANGNGKIAGHEASAKAGGARGAGAPGSRLAEAFEAVERFPVLLESRERVIAAATAETPRVNELVETVESDVALAISVLRFANRSGLASGGVGGVPEAVDVLKPSGVLAIAGTAPSFDFFESNGGWELKPERFRVHALATQRAAEQIGRAVGWAERDELAVTSLLHDVGRLVISRLHPGYKVYFDAVSRTPEQRLRDEREQLGIDHALVGGVLARRWNLPQRVAVARERHHAEDADGLAAMIAAALVGGVRARRWNRPQRVAVALERHHAEDAEGLAAMIAAADMVAHYSQAEAISPDRLQAAAERCGLDPDALRDILYELPLSSHDATRVSEPCPLSARELDVLRHLSEGMVYKQIAGEMQLSVSTIRTHLHNVYGKIGAVDRAQAVLTARDRGWI